MKRDKWIKKERPIPLEEKEEEKGQNIEELEFVPYSNTNVSHDYGETFTVNGSINIEPQSLTLSAGNENLELTEDVIRNLRNISSEDFNARMDLIQQQLTLITNTLERQSEDESN